MRALRAAAALALLSGATAAALSKSTPDATAVVHGHAQPFAMGDNIGGATITCVELPDLKLTTDDNGYFNFTAKVGQQLTLVLTHTLYVTTQTATVTVPPGGFPFPALHRISFQVPNDLTYKALELVLHDIGGPDDTTCVFVVTVCAFNKTLGIVPQGEPDAVVTLDPPRSPHNPFYFGVFKNGLTDPFTRGLNKTSADGGVIFFGIPPQKEPYTVRANKPGYKFSETKMHCRKGGDFVNGSPPQGPNSLYPVQQTDAQAAH